MNWFYESLLSFFISYFYAVLFVVFGLWFFVSLSFSNVVSLFECSGSVSFNYDFVKSFDLSSFVVTFEFSFEL